VQGDSRSGDKVPYTGDTPDPDTPTKCMQEHWNDAGFTKDLVCRKREVYMGKLSSARATCKEGDKIKVTVDSSIHFHSDRYDSGWFVAVDGGDALVGSCVLKTLFPNQNYNVIADDDICNPSCDPDMTSVGTVTWNQDPYSLANGKEPADKCGDVIFNGGGGGQIPDYPLLVDIEIACVDDNSDGNLDVSICTTWRSDKSDGFCTYDDDDPATQGDLADTYPAHPLQCFCARYDVPSITVIKKTSDTVVSPC
jgi:hypothetical protein